MLSTEDLSDWYDQINEYSRRSLTNISDRFPAFSGFAQAYARSTAYCYKAGVWQQDFHRGLLWTSYGGKVNWDHSPWSWATIEGNPEVVCLYSLHIGAWEFLNGPRAQIESCQIQYESHDKFGRVKSAQLRIKGLCKSLQVLWESTSFSFQTGCDLRDNRYVPVEQHHDLNIIQLFMDVLEDSLQSLRDRKSLLILQVARFGNLYGYSDLLPLGNNYMLFAQLWNKPYEATFGIVLERSGLQSSMYRRVGVAKIPLGISNEPGWQMIEIAVI